VIDETLSLDIQPRVLPASWRLMTGRLDTYACGGLRVIINVGRYGVNREPWIHVSVSRADRLPSWEDLLAVKTVFIGRDRKAIQVFPPEKEYVNICKTCLHLWAHWDNKDCIPDFRDPETGQI
jgi:hypothetical protein